MGYYANYGGHIILKNEVTDTILTLISNAFENTYVEKDNKTILVDGDEKYYEDEVTAVLNEIKDITECGEINYCGEDDCHWRFIYRNNDWVEENGRIYFESDMPELVSDEDKYEFIGQIVDIFEEYLENNHIEDDGENPLFYGQTYDDVTSKLYQMMTNWGVIKREGTKTQKPA